MSIEQLIEDAKKRRHEVRVEERKRKQAEKDLWGERFAQVLALEVWESLEIYPHEAEVRDHKHINDHPSLERVFETEGMAVRNGQYLGSVRFRMPLSEPIYVDVKVDVAPIHGRFECTLWGPAACGTFEEDGELVRVEPTQEKLDDQQRKNAMALGDMLLKFAEYRDSKIGTPDKPTHKMRNL